MNIRKIIREEMKPSFTESVYLIMSKDGKYIIDIYNLTKFDRLILAKLVTDYVNSGWPYYDYSDTVDNPDSPTKVANGRIRVQSFLENDKVILGQNIDKFDKFRHRISLSVEKTGSGS